MLYTSGTTGRPKGVMLTHDNIVLSAQNANAFDNFTADDTMLAYLPMAWVGDHIFSYGQSIAGAVCVACPEGPETIVEDRREIGPTSFFAPPRVFENLLTQIMVRMEDAGWFKKRMFHYFLGVANRCGEQLLDGRPVGGKDRLLYGLGNLMVYGPLRNRNVPCSFDTRSDRKPSLAALTAADHTVSNPPLKTRTFLLSAHALAACRSKSTISGAPLRIKRASIMLPPGVRASTENVL